MSAEDNASDKKVNDDTAHDTGFDYAIPFGRTTSTRGHKGAGPEFVGRDGERAFLTEALTSGGSRGSYLVTGRRGVGKSSFVEACVEEYEASVFKRFLRSRHGRSVPDLIMLGLFVFLVLVAALVNSDLLEQVASAPQDNPFLLLLSLPLAGLALAPLFYAQTILRAALVTFDTRSKWPFASGILLIWFGVICFIGPFGAPALSLSRFALGVALLLLAAQSMRCFTHTLPRSGFQRLIELAIIGTMMSVMMIGPDFLPKGVRDSLGSLMLFHAQDGDPLSVGNMVANNLMLAWTLFCCAIMWRMWPIETASQNEQGRKDIIRLVANRTLVLGTLMLLALVLVIFILVKVQDASDLWWPVFAVWLVVAATVWIIQLTRALKKSDPNKLRLLTVKEKEEKAKEREYEKSLEGIFRFAPPIEALLLVKALFFATVSLQLVYPVVNLAPTALAEVGQKMSVLGIDAEKNNGGGQLLELARSRPLLVCSQEIGEIKGRGCKEVVDWATLKGTPASEVGENDKDDRPYLTLFEHEHEERIWIIVAMMIIAMLFLAEFDWINRSMIAERQSSAIGLSPRFPTSARAHSHIDPVWIAEVRKMIEKNEEKEKEAEKKTGLPKKQNDWLKIWKSSLKKRTHMQRVIAMRRMERATLPWLIVQVWMPAIVIRVNLGFDTLDHRGVTHAMLFGLKNEYQKKFLNVFSGYAILVTFVTFMGVLLAVSYIGESAFDFPDVNYVTPAKKDDMTGRCKLALKEEGKPYNQQVCAVFAEDSDAWQGFFEPTTAAPVEVVFETPDTKRTRYEVARSLSLDFCAILFNRIANAPDNIHIHPGPTGSSEIKTSLPTPGSATIPRMLCNAAPETARLLLPILFAEILPIHVSKQVAAKQEETAGHLAFSFLHDNRGLPQYEDGSIRTVPSLSLRVYHVLTFLVLYVLWRWLSQRFSIHPYRTTVRHIDELMQSLEARSTRKQRFSFLEPATALSNLFSQEHSEEVQREKLDPRSVELALLNVLEEVRNTETGLFGGAVTLPVPELTFIFDELDKISGVLGAGTNVTSSANVDKTALDQERRRAYALHQLMSDMKRVISSAPARFIFVGNRLLHDEWTADRSRRQPLLTSIFDTEIYLPSLMLDTEGTLGAGRPQKRLSHRIKEYVLQRHNTAHENYDRFVEDRLSPFPVLREHRGGATSYPQDALVAAEAGSACSDTCDECTGGDGVVSDLQDASVVARPGSTSSTTLDERPESDIDFYQDIQLLRILGPDRMGGRVTAGKNERTQFLRAFAHFLTFRSGGNPKKLQELLNEFIRPAARLSHPGDTERWSGQMPLNCEDVLFIHGRSIYRIQLIDTLFMHLVERFEEELIDRDDKVAEAILYLFDFLMKFHTRAFSWSSLERVEELVHIHRTPDLRAILARIVEDASERWLHRLLNGMYDFRFRSDFAIELRYLSRLHQPEAAALNFTLDEAQGLKANYIAVLREAEETGGRRDQEAIAGLGELHEYDQEFAEARARYLEAIDEIDARFARIAGETVSLYDPVQESADAAASTRGARSRAGTLSLLSRRPGPEPVPFMHAIMAQDPQGMRVAGLNAPWGIRRLRLMLQVAMTFELARDFEPAKVHYLDARLFAWSLIEMYPPMRDPKLGETSDKVEQTRIDAANDIAKHINLLYQPIFAEAWISEKLENGVDTACSLVESDLLRLRRRLPFLNDLDVTKKLLTSFVDENGETTREGGAGDSNLALVGAELHNKAGDLYFFKGKGAVPVDGLNIYLARKNDHERKLREKLSFNLDSFDREATLIEIAGPDHSGSSSGMLLRAHYHYAVALHELRRYVAYRRLTSGAKMNPLRSDDGSMIPGLTIGRREWPTFVPQSIYNTLSDMAETVLARVSFFSLMDEIRGGLPSKQVEVFMRRQIKSKNLHKDFFGTVCNWFEMTDDATREELEELRNPKEAAEADMLSLLFHEVAGEWVGGDAQEKKYPHLVMFNTLESQTERLIVGLALSVAAADMAEKAGYPEDAAREHLLVMELCSRYLKWIVTVEALQKYDGELGLKETRDVIRGSGKSGHLRELKIALGKIALHSATEYNRLTWRSWRRSPHPEACLIGQQVSPEAVTLVCTIADMMERPVQRAQLMKLTTLWLGDCCPDIKRDDDMTERPIKVLKHVMEIFRYPALNQLLSYKAMIDQACIAIIEGRVDCKELPYADFERMYSLYEKLNAPLHFTPAMMGESAALVVIAGLKKDARKDREHQRTVRRAIEMLTASRETYSMGRAYYSAIADLNYLYDDYNDRRIHANHAAQMAGGELHAVLLKLMEEAERKISIRLRKTQA